MDMILLKQQRKTGTIFRQRITYAIKRRLLGCRRIGKE